MFTLLLGKCCSSSSAAVVSARYLKSVKLDVSRSAASSMTRAASSTDLNVDVVTTRC